MASGDKKRSKKGISIKNSETFTIILCLVVVLILTGVINFNFLSNSTTPSAEVAEEVCAKYGNVYEVKEDSALSDLQDYLVKTYFCKSEDKDPNSKEAKMSFTLYEFNRNSFDIPLFKVIVENKNAHPAVGVQEDSDSYFKVVAKTRNLASYSALYKNFYATVEASSIEFAEDILAELQFPDRNRAATIDYETKVNDINNHNQEIIDKVTAALLSYQMKEGSLPAITPDDENGNKQTNINGTGNSDYDTFYNTLGELIDPAGKQYLLDVADLTDEGSDDSDNQNNNINIKYGFYCDTSDGENYSIKKTNDKNIFTVTLKGANGGLICAGTRESEEG